MAAEEEVVVVMELLMRRWRRKIYRFATFILVKNSDLFTRLKWWGEKIYGTIFSLSLYELGYGIAYFIQPYGPKFL